MDWLSGETMNLLMFLLPGFVAASVYYSLTSHLRPSRFDLIVQALIFTVLVQALVYGIPVLEADKGAIGYSKGWSLAISLSIAVLIALLAAWSTNKDVPHKFLRQIGVTHETSYPSEWHSSFARLADKHFVVLHLKDHRRLYGWPEEWPSQPDQGHFRITWGEWLACGGQSPSETEEGNSTFLIPVDEVKMIEFITPDST